LGFKAGRFSSLLLGFDGVRRRRDDPGIAAKLSVIYMRGEVVCGTVIEVPVSDESLFFAG